MLKRKFKLVNAYIRKEEKAHWYSQLKKLGEKEMGKEPKVSKTEEITEMRNYIKWKWGYLSSLKTMKKIKYVV